MARKFGLIVLSTLGYLLVADLAGVAGAFFCDAIVTQRKVSTALFYTIWFVDGVFCGMLHYLSCGNIAPPRGTGESMDRKDKGQTGILAILTTGVILAALAFFFYKHDWRYPRADSVYVPDSEGLTLTFFVTILAMMIFTHHTMGPVKRVPARKKKK